MFRLSLTVLLNAALITGCGFHLRGLESANSSARPFDYDALHLVLKPPNIRLGNLLKQALMRRDVRVTDESELQLVVERFQQNRRTVALNSAAKAAEYELKTSADFYLFTQEHGAISKTATVTVLRNFSNDPDQVTGKLEEERLLQDEMLREIVRRIIQRLQTTEVTSPTVTTEASTSSGTIKNDTLDGTTDNTITTVTDMGSPNSSDLSSAEITNPGQNHYTNDQNN